MAKSLDGATIVTGNLDFHVRYRMITVSVSPYLTSDLYVPYKHSQPHRTLFLRFQRVCNALSFDILRGLRRFVDITGSSTSGFTDAYSAP